MFLKRKLKNALKYYKLHQVNLNKILDYFETNELEYALIGGFVRDVVAFDMFKKEGVSETNDFDIIVDTDYEDVRRMLKFYRIPFTPNDFGSFKIKESPESTFNHEIDIWCLKDHRPFTTGLFKQEWKELPYTSWLTYCGAVYLPLSNKVYLGELKQTLKEHDIKMYRPELFWNNEIDNKFILAGKLFYLWYEKGFSMNGECMTFLSLYLSRENHVKKVAEYIENHYTDYVHDWKKRIEREMSEGATYKTQFLFKRVIK